ncbi:MAG: hypothetical protein KBE09_03220 [Candidatus Pacebacteria bacterium]|nr:hypothetical protein [Candidatus Paceibacterota bacterium]
MHYINVKKALLLSAAVVVAIGALLFFWPHQKTALPAFTPENLASVPFWESRIDDGDARAAYEELAREGAKQSYEQQHRYAHAFGEALYNSAGVSGIAVCDARFSFGCYHAFLGAAIADKGLGSVNALNEACFEALPGTSLSCQHGIGHGILTDMGYDFTHIKQALDMCAALPHSDPIGGCYGGVFMEYDSRTMWGDSAVSREGDKNKPFEVCEQLDATYGPACAFWTPQWWSQAFFGGGDNKVEHMKEMGAWCEGTLFGKRFTRDCFEGIGNIVTFTAGFDPDRARALCEATSQEGQHRLWCLRLAANHFGIDVSPEAGLKVCSGLTSSAKEICEAYAANKANIAQPL